MKKTLFALAAVIAVAGCAGNKQETRVSDADLGRLGPGQMGPVEQARQFQASARDEQARAKLRLDQAQHEVAIAKADQTAAQADQDRADAQAKIADANREPAQLDKARQLKEQADLHKQTADAHMKWAKELVDARQASVDAAQKQVQLGDSRLEWAKLQALKQANVPANSKYDAYQFQNQVNDNQKSFEEAMQKARQADAQASGSQRMYEDLQRQLQAKNNAVQTG